MLLAKHWRQDNLADAWLVAIALPTDVRSSLCLVLRWQRVDIVITYLTEQIINYNL